MQASRVAGSSNPSVCGMLTVPMRAAWCCLLAFVAAPNAVPNALPQRPAAVRCEGIPVLNLRVGVELSWDYLQTYCAGDVDKGRAHVVELIQQFNQWTVPELQLHLDLRESVLPRSADEDPTLASSDKQLVMDAIAKRFRTSDHPNEDLHQRLDLGIKLCPPARIGGGLAYCPPGSGNFAYLVAGFGGQDGWGVLLHEFAHTLDQWHEYGFPYENGVMGGRGVATNPFAAAPATASHYSRRETEGMTRCAKEVRLLRGVDKSSGLVDAKGLWKAAVAPKALLDHARVKRGKDGRFEPLLVDVLKNDRSVNSGSLFAQPVAGGRSLRGGTVEPAAGKGGKGQLLYTPPSGVAPDGSTWDHFHYKLVHSNGLEDTGEVVVFYDLDDDMVVDGGFESITEADVARGRIDAEGKLSGKGSKWRFFSSKPQLRASRPYLRPWRGWYRTDLADLLEQEDDRRWLRVAPMPGSQAGRSVIARQELDDPKRMLKPGRDYRVTWECLEGRPPEMHAALVWPNGERSDFRLARIELGDQGPSTIHHGTCTVPNPAPSGAPELEIAATIGPATAPFHLDNATLHLEAVWPVSDQGEVSNGR